MVTGAGVVSSIGTGKQYFWDALIKGKSGITEITSFDTSNFPVHYGAEIRDFQPQELSSKRKTAKIGRASSLACAAAELALEDSRINPQDLEKKRAGVCLGTTMGESQIIEKLNSVFVNKGIEAVDRHLILNSPSSVLSANLAAELKLRGASLVISNACAAGNFAIGYAYDLIRLGEAEMMLAGGADAFSRLALTGFSRMFAVAPEKCQPFDKNRKGMIVGEGAGIVILESLDDALARGAEIYAEVLGYGLSCDAHHITAPYSYGIKEAITGALSESKISPFDVDYISAHGTGTVANDKEECLAIKQVFRENYKKIPVSSIKSMIGHSMGASSAIEAIVCCLAIKHEIIPPTINYETPDPECDIDCVPNIARGCKINIALNNASAFGGNNSCLVFKRYAA